MRQRLAGCVGRIQAIAADSGMDRCVDRCGIGSGILMFPGGVVLSVALVTAEEKGLWF